MRVDESRIDESWRCNRARVGTNYVRTNFNINKACEFFTVKNNFAFLLFLVTNVTNTVVRQIHEKEMQEGKMYFLGKKGQHWFWH